MIWWLADHGVSVVLVLAIAAVILIVVWWTNRSPKLLIALASIALLMVLTWLLSLVVVTDRTRLALTLRDMAQSVRERQIDRLFDKISPTFQRGTMDKARFHEYVKSRLERYQVRDFRVDKVAFPGVLDRTLRRAQVEFWVEIDATIDVSAIPVRVEAEFTFEDGQWRLNGYKVFPGRSPYELQLPD